MTDENAQSQEPGAEQRGLKQALEQLNTLISELFAYSRHFGRVQLDAVEVRVHRTAMKLAMGFFGVLGFTALTFVLLLYCIHAVARGFAAWAGWPDWAGELLVGSICLVALSTAGFCWYYRRERKRIEVKREAYDERIRKQQARYDRNVHSIGAAGAAV